MAYIGPSSSDVYKSMATQTITGDGSAQSFTLDQSVSDSSSVRFVVNNDVQKLQKTNILCWRGYY